MNHKILSICMIAFLLVAGCAPASSSSTGQPAASVADGQVLSRPAQAQAPAAAAAPADETHTHATGVDLTHLPLGDGHVSTQPLAGSVWSCQSSFNGRGADHIGDWVNGDGTYDLTK